MDGKKLDTTHVDDDPVVIGADVLHCHRHHESVGAGFPENFHEAVTHELCVIAGGGKNGDLRAAFTDQFHNLRPDLLIVEVRRTSAND
jgi:hypothetical protein